MKKILLPILSLVLAVGMNAQTTVTFDATVDKSSSADAGAVSVEKDGVTIAVSNGILGNGSEYRCYKSQTFTVTSTVGNITSIEMTCTASGTTKYGPGCFSDPTSGTYTYDAKIGTWTGDAAEVSLTASENQVRMTEVVVTIAAEAGTVAKPSISPKSGTYYEAQEVTISASDGCTVYYSINDGTEQQYTSSFTLSDAGTYAISAYAQDADGNKSDVTTVTIVIEDIATYTTTTALRDACTATSSSSAPTVNFTFSDLLVTGVYNSYVFVRDDAGSYLLYGSNSGLTKGDKISGTIQGALYAYNSLGELAVSDSYANITIDSQDNTVTPVDAEITDVIDSYSTYEAEYVKFSGVSPSAEAVSSKYLEISNADGDNINIYDSFSLLTDETFYTDKTYNVSCYVVNYKGTVQVYVLDVDDIELITDLATPESAWSAESESIVEGETATATFSTTSDGDVTYASSDESVATVDENGVITGVGAGTCTITATTAETATYVITTSTISITVSAYVGGIETFANGSFEEWDSESQPTGWKSTTTASSATLEQSTDSYDGNYAVIVKNATSNKRLAYKEMLLPAGYYTMAFYAKSVDETLAEARPGYAPWDSENDKMGNYAYGDYTDTLSSTEWTKVSYTFQLEEETQINLVVMNPKSSDSATYGDLLIDAFTFEEITADEYDVITGISSVDAATDETTTSDCYNVGGQKVSSSYRGIVIEKGKKVLKR